MSERQALWALRVAFFATGYLLAMLLVKAIAARNCECDEGQSEQAGAGYCRCYEEVNDNSVPAGALEVSR